MKLSDATNTGERRKARKRIGRGNASGQGKTSGRGEKGQKSRSGYSRRAGFEGGQMPLTRRVPKRGFKNFCRKEYTVVNVSDLNRFEDGTEIGPAEIRRAGLANAVRDGIKILGDGELTKKVTVKAHKFSKSAVAKIEAAGGRAEVV